MNAFFRTQNKQVSSANTQGIATLKQMLHDADCIIIGAGAGLSTSAGYIYTGERLTRYFADFCSAYSMPDMYSGGFIAMELEPEVMWAYWSRYIYINRFQTPPHDTYQKLLQLVEDKDYFVITTNVDHCFQRAAFDKHRLFYTQGDYGLWQCSVPCHQKTYNNEEQIKEMLLAQGFTFSQKGELLIGEDTELKMRIPSELVPVCPRCGEPMTMNLRADNSFVEDEGWHQAAERYSEFLRRHKHLNTLFFELGVGANTPVIIKIPFMQMTASWNNAQYCCINYGEAFAPAEIADRALCINADIDEVLDKVISYDRNI